jgi:Phosphotransferase enzyme family/Nucleotidyl transferase AbiEii toxin, Type IV TA system
VDLFADWQRRADFPTAVDKVIAAYQAEGLDVQVDLRLDTFARLHVTDPNRQHRVELVANWRAQPPVHMDIGPVLHPDDVMAGKMDALYNRAAARDFLDIDAAITSGRYTLEHLCQLAHDADAGFDRQLFATMLARQLEFGRSELGMHTEWLERGRRWLGRDDLLAESMVLIHGDLHPGHTLVDNDGTLVGVLDWTEADVGGPGQEFVETARKFEPAMLDALLDAYVQHGGPAWPGLRGHVIEAIAFAPLALAQLGFEVGKQRYVDAARTLFASQSGSDQRGRTGRGWHLNMS